ncbi:MAG: hypothetical protein IKU37_00725 [Candidatus Gastranaerophilales bacterium]|nr:hypothetical protein [Candidatus Gastranaerophilales bacterium]
MKIFKNTLKILLVCLFLNIGFIGFCADAISSQLSKIERQIWGFEYSKDDTVKRLSRIENNVFGSISKGANESRIKKLNEALGIESYEDSLKQAYEIDTTEVSGVNYPQIDALEYQMFYKTFDKENIYKRLDRLEKKIFGSTQDGNLASRTDRLKAYVRKDTVAQNPNYHIEKPYQQTHDVEQYMNSQDKYENSDIFIQLAGLESTLFMKTYSQDPVGLRLNRLERKIFQRDFSSDDDYLRIQRLQAAASAQQTAKLYEANKIQKLTSTGMQLGSLLLMILALIL